MDPEKYVPLDILNMCIYSFEKKSKNPKLIPKLDMIFFEKSKNPKLIPKLDIILLEKKQQSKINSEVWYEFIDIFFPGSNYVLKYRFSMKYRIFDIVIILS